jgi:tripartite-type tricarboxylate transporter receptor subunit TctC
MRFCRRTLLLAVFALAAVAAPNVASAQSTFPTRPITLVVPAAAGGPTDTVARLIAESMSRTLGQTVIVENVGGAGGTIGMARVAKAAPDGYTIAVWHVGQATAPALYDGLKYDVVNDFDHIGRITDVPMTIVSKTPFPANNITELLAWMKSEAAKASYGHAGIGSASHLCGLVFLKEVGVQMNGIAYRGTGPAMNDLLSGQFDIMCDQTTNTTNHINAGKIKGYAVTTKSRVPSVPQLPTLDSGRHSRFRRLGLARHVGAEGPAERCVRQIRRGAADGAQGSEGDRALRQSRHRARCARARNARCAQVASCRGGEAMGRRDQGGGC